MITEKTISALAEEKLQGTNLFLLEIAIGNGNTIKVFLDGDQGVSIDNCKMVSRHIESNLDREKEDFSLEVSSAGLSRPLTMQRQYKKNVGKLLKVRTDDDQELIGKLTEVTEQEITLEIEPKKKKEEIINQTLAIEHIKEAKIEITF